MTSLIWNPKRITQITKQKQTHRLRTSLWLPAGRIGMQLGMDMDKQLY